MTLKSLFLDLNSYFASVEQQVRPQLRGRPVAVTPVMADSGCCIAASYEAKKFGVRTGTRVREAKQLCPGIELVKARPRLYVLMHKRVLEAIERCIPVQAVHSIDEVSCRLDPRERTPEEATALALRIKASIAEHAGVWMRCSIGIAPNRFLSKVATDMQKPDGLVVIEKKDLPQKLYSLKPIEIAGIGPKMSERLLKAGITTVEQLCAKSEKEMEKLWGGVVGRRWYLWLRGEELPEGPTHKRSLGHQHVLGPEHRTDEGAKAMAQRLLHKAAERLRHDGYAAQRLTLSIRMREEGMAPTGWRRASWSVSASLGPACSDTATMLEALEELWKQRPAGVPTLVDVTLTELVNTQSQTLPLFQGENRRTRLSKAMDLVNEKYGANTLYTSSIHEARASGSGGIAFNYVPDLELPDTVRERGEGAMSDEELVKLIERMAKVR
ncbi:MAG: DNA polymerase [Phycisphaerales bacterium]|nr:DNA polymerase [Phycisphaerales bacterium]